LQRKENKMGWWRTVEGGVIGDAAVDYLEELEGQWIEPADVPVEVRAEIATLYLQGIGQPPSEQDLRDLLAFSR
jgi:hypothetical protein